MRVELVKNPNWSKVNQSVAFLKHAVEELNLGLQRTSSAELLTEHFKHYKHRTNYFHLYCTWAKSKRPHIKG